MEAPMRTMSTPSMNCEGELRGKGDGRSPARASAVCTCAERARLPDRVLFDVSVDGCTRQPPEDNHLRADRLIDDHEEREANRH
eukprot:scaffold41_cov90-Isochrysis_galbana.AAC.4